MYCISLSSGDGKQDVGLRRRLQRVHSSSVCVNSSVFLRKSPPRKRTHFLRRPFIARFSCMCICCSAQPHPSAGMWLLLLISARVVPPPHPPTPPLLLPGFGFLKRRPFSCPGLPPVQSLVFHHVCAFLTSSKWQIGLSFCKGGWVRIIKNIFD